MFFAILLVFLSFKSNIPSTESDMVKPMQYLKISTIVFVLSTLYLYQGLALSFYRKKKGRFLFPTVITRFSALQLLSEFKST